MTDTQTFEQTFPNGLPEPGSTVEVKTVWSADWETVKFAAPMNNPWYPDRKYRWFGVFAKPESQAEIIVTEWRYPNIEVLRSDLRLLTERAKGE